MAEIGSVLVYVIAAFGGSQHGTASTFRAGWISRDREKRTAERRNLAVAGQIVWKDARGDTRLTSVVTRDVSEHGVSVECLNGAAIPLYRLVYFQVDRDARHRPDLPESLRKPNVLSAIFRVGPYSQATGAPSEYALRLLVEPVRRGPNRGTEVEPDRPWVVRRRQDRARPDDVGWSLVLPGRHRSAPSRRHASPAFRHSGPSPHAVDWYSLAAPKRGALVLPRTSRRRAGLPLVPAAALRSQTPIRASAAPGLQSVAHIANEVSMIDRRSSCSR